MLISTTFYTLQLIQVAVLPNVSGQVEGGSVILTGEQKIAADRAAVWRVLNDPDVLRQCIPGCQSLERDGEDGFTAIVAIKVGPIGARFSGSVHLMDIDPPNGYRLVGQGNGGAAGSAKGSATVSLRDDGGATVLTYEVETSVGGRSGSAHRPSFSMRIATASSRLAHSIQK